jgi:putative ABC transport system ATP-binding protein
MNTARAVSPRCVILTAMPLIDLQHITKTFEIGDDKFHALNDVSLSVEPGEFLAIMGPSGSGKSTLMNVIGLLDRPTSGTYTLDGKQVSLAMSDTAQAKLRSETIGFIFQNFNLLANLDVLNNVALPAQYRALRVENAKARATTLLEQVGLGKRLKFQTNKLSGGERQRVAIARALMNEPHVILADEPTGNLDSKSGEEVMNILKDLNAKGTTLLMVTHSEELAAIAHRIVRLKDGRIVS